jgi:hypothetical protein
MRDISKRLRGGDFRHAVQAVGALLHLDPASRASLVPQIDTADEQRAFQLLIARLVAEGGGHGLAARWGELPSPHWRETLVSEIGQSFYLWVDEGTIELLLAALEDKDSVARQALGTLIACLREPTARERKQLAKTKGGRAAREALDQAAAWMTPARRARIAAAVTEALDRCRDNPKALLWPDKYIELLGLSATRADQHAVDLLEGFRPIAGETRRTTFEKLDPDNLPWTTAMVAERKGIPPGTPFVRVMSLGTGLLDLKGLEEAIERIRRREA